MDSASSCGPHQAAQSRPEPIGAVPIPTGVIARSVAPSIRLSISETLRVAEGPGSEGWGLTPWGQTPVLVQRRKVRAENAVAPEERDDRPKCEERAERNPYLPRLLAVSREEEDARDHRREHPCHQRDRDGLAERDAH